VGLIEWSPEYSVHHDKIDAQHKKWIAIINELHEALVQGHEMDQMGGLLQEMMDYTNFHFAAEEKLLQEIDYPDFNRHRLLHNNFKKDIMKYENDFTNGKTLLRTEVMSAIKRWLEDHILVEDKKISTCLDKNKK